MCTIVTTQASAELADLHDRMPVVLAPGEWGGWLDPGLDDLDALQAMLRPSEGFEQVPVSTAVNSVRNDGPELLEPPETDVADS